MGGPKHKAVLKKNLLKLSTKYIYVIHKPCRQYCVSSFYRFTPIMQVFCPVWWLINISSHLSVCTHCVQELQCWGLDPEMSDCFIHNKWPAARIWIRNSHAALDAHCRKLTNKMPELFTPYSPLPVSLRNNCWILSLLLQNLIHFQDNWDIRLQFDKLLRTEFPKVNRKWPKREAKDTFGNIYLGWYCIVNQREEMWTFSSCFEGDRNHRGP